MYFDYFNKHDFDLDGVSTRTLTNIAKYSTIFSQVADDISFYSYYTLNNADRLDTISNNLYGTPEYYWTIPLINPSITNVFRDLRRDSGELLRYVKRKYPDTALILDDGTDILGEFQVGDEVFLSTNVNVTGTVTGVYPTQGYITVDVTSGSFPVNTDFTLNLNLEGDWLNDVGLVRYDFLTNNWSQDLMKDPVRFKTSISEWEAPHHHVNADDEWVLYDRTPNTPVSNREYEDDLNDVKSQIKVIRPRYIYDVVKEFESEMKRR